jgi:Kdo2-lipid IVA lauroyltransferase/acyltransferase
VFSYIGYKILELIVILTPYPITYLIAEFGARLWFLTGSSVRIIKTNISKVMDIDLNSSKTNEIALSVFINWAKNIADFLKHSIMPVEKFKKRVEVKGLKNLDNALKKGKGVVIFTAHIGNFEWGACRLATEGYNIWGVSMYRKNRLTRNFFELKRLSKGLKTLYINRILNVFRILKNNEIIAIPSDWDPTGHAAKPFKFFGKTAYFPTGAVQIALKSGAQLLPSFIWRKDKYTHFHIIGSPIKLTLKGDKETLINKNMGKILKVMEEYVSSHISEWEMFHNIWG